MFDVFDNNRYMCTYLVISKHFGLLYSTRLAVIELSCYKFVCGKVNVCQIGKCYIRNVSSHFTVIITFSLTHKTHFSQITILQYAAMPTWCLTITVFYKQYFHNYVKLSYRYSFVRCKVILSMVLVKVQCTKSLGPFPGQSVQLSDR